MLDTSLDSSNFYFLLAVFQGLVLSSLIVFLRPGRKPHTYFGILLFLLSMALLHSVMESSIHAFNTVFPVPMNFELAFGPLAYLHILHLKDPLRKFKRRDLWHFLPSLLLDVVLFTSTFLYLGAHMDWAYDNIPLIQSVALAVAAFDAIQLSIYTYLIYRQSADTQPVLREFGQVRKWLSLLIVSWSVGIGFMIIAIPISLVFIEQLDDNSEWLYLPLGTINALWIFLLGFLYLLRYAKVVGSYMDKISRFRFSANELDEKKKQIIDALAREQLYKDPQLTVSKLAGHLGWPINSVSKMVNETLQTNFNDLINQYRVAAFKERATMEDRHKYSILGLGEEVGFSSKASFYRVFKKETGMTPAEFMKSHV